MVLITLLLNGTKLHLFKNTIQFRLNVQCSPIYLNIGVFHFCMALSQEWERCLLKSWFLKRQHQLRPKLIFAPDEQ